MTRLWSRIRGLGFLLVAAVAVLAMLAEAADARSGRGGSFGSRGARTFTAPPSTNTAPREVAPLNRSMTQPGIAATAGKGMGAAAPASRFGGWQGLLMGGLFAAGLAGLFGMGGLASVLGFLLQALLIGGLVFLGLAWWRSRSAPQPAMAGAPSGRGGSYASRDPRRTFSDIPAAHNTPRTAAADEPSTYRPGPAAASGAGSIDIAPALDLTKDDFDTFEARLGAIQAAYGEGDTQALARLLTPEMLSYFTAELADNAKAGIRNEVSDAKLLQGDLAEAWRESAGEYASVALRYSLLDADVDVATGDVVAGSRTEPLEVTEVWTFTRPRGGSPRDWELSAIQQA